MSNRVSKVNELIKRELSQIITREVEFPKGVLVTVTRVETTSNLAQAKVYISALSNLASGCLGCPHPCPGADLKTNEKELAKGVLEILNNNLYELQQALNKRLSMRPVPRIRFAEEVGAQEAGKIEQVLEEIKDEKRD